MQKLAIAKIIHGHFLAPKDIKGDKSAKGDGSDLESEEETDEDDYNLELGDQNLTAGGSAGISVNCTRLKKITGEVSALTFYIFCCIHV